MGTRSGVGADGKQIFFLAPFSSLRAELLRGQTPTRKEKKDSGTWMILDTFSPQPN